MKWTRTIVFSAAAVAIGAAVYMGLQPQPLEIEVAAVKRGPMRVTIEEEGKTRLRDRYVVSAPVAGRLQRVPWKVGDAISAGQVVTSLIPTPLDFVDARRRSEAGARMQSAAAARDSAEARLRATQEQLKSASAESAYWKQQLAREEDLLKAGDLQASRVDRTRTELRRADATRTAAEEAVTGARFEVDRARADIEAVKASVSDPEPRRSEIVEVKSPVSGRVLKVVRDSEGVVAPGTSIVEIGNTRAIEVEVELLSADAVRVGPGTPVELTRWGGDFPLKARIRQVEPTGYTKISALGVEEQRVRVIAGIVSPEEQWQRLGEGYRVEASFILWEGEGVLQVPASALFRPGEGWAVFAVDGGFARRRAVQVAHRNGLVAEIAGGLREGEQVIPHPDDAVKDGQAVRLRLESGK